MSENSTATRLLVVAAELFREKGFAASSTRMIAERLGIQQASLYYYMQGKDDLLFSISMTSLEHLEAAVSEAVGENQEDSIAPRERMERLIRAHLTSTLEDRDMHATMLSDMRSLPPERLAEVLAARTRYEELVRSVIADSQRAGTLRRDVTSRSLTMGLLNLLNWSIFSFDPRGDLTVDELADLLAAIFLDGAVVKNG
jgi:TetR/AcrR family transcriptional regulator, cholesterol catabolism regulator